MHRAVRTSMALAFLGLLLTGCPVPLSEGSGVVDDFVPPTIYIAAPCELVDRIDVTTLSDETGSIFDPGCDRDQFYWYFVDYADPTKKLGLGERLTEELANAVEYDGVQEIQRFCDGRLILGSSKPEFPFLREYDIHDIEIDCSTL